MPNSRGFSLLIGETIVAVDTEQKDQMILITQSKREFLISCDLYYLDDEAYQTLICNEINPQRPQVPN